MFNKSYLNAFFLELLVYLGGWSYCYACYSGVHCPFSFWLYALDLFRMQSLSYLSIRKGAKYYFFYGTCYDLDEGISDYYLFVVTF